MARRAAQFMVVMAAACPLAASANTGVGFVLITVPLAVLLLVPVIVLEALVLARMLRLAMRPALAHSGWANLASALAGMILGFAIDASGLLGSHEPTRDPALLSLIPMFLISWVVEYCVLRARVPRGGLPPRRRGSAALAANAASYALFAVAVFVQFRPESQYFSASRMGEVTNAAGVVKTDVAEYYQTHRRFPPPGPREPTGRYIRSLLVAEGGRIVVELKGPSDIAGRTFVYQPRLRDGVLVDWACGSDVPRRYLPAHCRNAVPAP